MEVVGDGLTKRLIDQVSTFTCHFMPEVRGRRYLRPGSISFPEYTCSCPLVRHDKSFHLLCGALNSQHIP